MTNSVEYFRCSCRTEVLAVERDGEETYISVYHQACSTWVSRIRHIWRILRHGTPYEDEIVLDSLTRLRLAHFLKDETD